MGVLDTILDVAETAVGFVTNPVGTAIGLAGDVADFIFGEDETATAQAGLGNASGGGGAGSSWTTQTPPGLPTPPTNQTGFNLPTPPPGGLQGPVYGTQALPAGAQQALSVAMSALRAWPVISDFIQRQWNFPTEAEVSVPKSPMLWRALAQQLPTSHREALEQFLVGFPSPVGLSKAASDVFLALVIAEAGYSPDVIGCCKESK